MLSIKSIVPVFGLLAAVSAAGHYSNDTIVYETVTVATLTTFCPEPTTLTHGTKTYTVTKPTTLTITDCPCTVTKPVKPTHPTSPPLTLVAPPPKPTGSNGTWAPPVWVTTTVSEFTTYCPAPTTFTHGNKTYTATESTTLTIKDCPCTVSYPPISSKTVTISTLTTYCPVPTTISVGTTTYPVTAPGTVTIPIVSVTEVPGTPPTPTPEAPAVTTPVAGAPAPTGTRVPTGPAAGTTGPAQVTANAGDKVGAGFGALAVAGLVALL